MRKKVGFVILVSSLLLIGCAAHSRDSKSNAIASLFENAKKESQSSSSLEELSSLNSGDKSSFSSVEESLESDENIASTFSQSQSSSSEETISSHQESISSTSIAPTYDHIDVDLTSMNSTMVYSQVLNMLDEPHLYIGKIVKMAGPFKPYGSTNPSYCFPAILITDATACCASGIEFLLYGVPLCSMAGGNGYPLYEEEATIVGRFETYLEGSDMYIHLVDAIWLK